VRRLTAAALTKAQFYNARRERLERRADEPVFRTRRALRFLCFDNDFGESSALITNRSSSAPMSPILRR